MGYEYQNVHKAEAGLNLLFVSVSKLPNHEGSLIFSSYASVLGLIHNGQIRIGQSLRLGCGFNFWNGYGPNIKLGIENNTDGDFRLSGGLGVSLGELIQINYKYALPLGIIENKLISRHSIGILIVLNPAPVLRFAGPK